MTAGPNICIVIPVFNHALTVGRVVRASKNHFPVLAINDGSTDDTGQILGAETGIEVITLPQNQGKGAALRAGLAAAEKQGFTHAITIDADGQHAPDELPWFAAACRRQPEALVVGIRDLAKEQAPRRRRVINRISAFWFKTQTGLSLADAQCGYRAYPLAGVNRLRIRSQRYAFELEVLVKAAWNGTPILPQPVSADYQSATSRLSHFDPWRDTLRISLLHTRLSLLRLFF